MRARSSVHLSLALIIGALVCPVLAMAQPAIPGDSRNAASLAAVPPPVPKPRSPVDAFRELLAMRASEWPRALSNRPPENQKLLIAKLREYQALSPNERELRLRTTELRYFLLPMLKMDPAQRSTRLAAIPEEFQELIRHRLAAWDKVPAELQRDLLENEDTIRYFSETQARTERAQDEELLKASPVRRAQLEGGVARWRRLPEAQRQQVMQRFDEMFTMSTGERETVLKTLSEPERAQIEKTLSSFGKLPPQQRAQCVRSLAKFINLSPSERSQFLRSAERWKLLSPDQRNSWREMVNKLASLPPMPPLPSSANPWPSAPIPSAPFPPLPNVERTVAHGN